jgi:hypothetical protein
MPMRAIASARANEYANFSLGIRPDAASQPKPLHQPTILHGEKSEAVFAQTGLGEKLLNFVQQISAHAQTMTRHSVLVKTRYNVSTAC